MEAFLKSIKQEIKLMPELDLFTMSPFVCIVLVLSVVLLLFDAIEVGRNDGTNIVNSVFGARILSRNWAIIVAGIGVVLGAYFSSDVMETARKGIFNPASFTILAALSIYVSVYVVDTILLYSYSAFGMPVSTTMTLVFELLGASLFLSLVIQNDNAVNWANASRVIVGIVCSIMLSGFLGFFLQRIARGAIRNKWNKLTTLLLHGGWVGGGLMAGLIYFMLLKGMKNIEVIKNIKERIFSYEYGSVLFLFALWVFCSILIHICLCVWKKKAAKLLFPALTVIGMLSMGFAFGQNDLANCASPGLAVIKLVEGSQHGMTVADINKVPIGSGMLLVCGFLLVLGMWTKEANRVTKAEVRVGSCTESHVKLYAPNWCIWIADKINIWHSKDLEPLSSTSKPKKGHTHHYDPLRACVIVCVSACVIATASALGLPVSTTYVAFAAVIATGIADRIYTHGEASLKLGRSIWVVFCWFLAAVIATLASGIVCIAIFYMGIYGIVLTLLGNFTIRRLVKQKSEIQETRLREEEKKILSL